MVNAFVHHEHYEENMSVCLGCHDVTTRGFNQRFLYYNLNMELGISTWFGFNYSYERRIQLIKDAEFQSVMLWWGEESDEENAPREHKPDIIRKYGLNIENMHFSFAEIDEIWKDTLDGEELVKKYLLFTDDCKTHEIPAAVMHVTGGEDPPPYNRLGLDRFKRIIEKAEKNGVTIALENVWRLDYLDYLFDNIKSDKIKFCYDSGHENCFTPDIDCLAKYGDKLAALHLHDNIGKNNLQRNDLHMLPFSGTVNWKRIMKKLNELNYQGTLSFEVDAQYSNVMNQYTAESFLHEAKVRAEKLLMICE